MDINVANRKTVTKTQQAQIYGELIYTVFFTPPSEVSASIVHGCTTRSQPCGLSIQSRVLSCLALPDSNPFEMNLNVSINFTIEWSHEILTHGKHKH